MCILLLLLLLINFRLDRNNVKNYENYAGLEFKMKVRKYNKISSY